MIFVYIVLATISIGLVAVVGALTFVLPKKTLGSFIKSLVAYSAGALFGGAFFHLTVESVEDIGLQPALYILALGFISFYVLERYLWYRHCHEGNCDFHPVSYLILIGDAIHNFIDGLVIAASFLVSPQIGLATTLMVVFHEIPQELGDYGVLVHSGLTPKKALVYNFLSQLFAVVGGVLGYFTLSVLHYSSYLLALAAGGFLYISASDLIPEIHRHSEEGKATYYLLLFVLGLALMIALKFFGE